MTTTPLVVCALLAIPIVLLLATTGCGLDPIPYTPPKDDAPPPEDPTQKPAPGGGVLVPTPATPPTYSELVRARTGLIGYWRLGEPNTILSAPNPKAVNSHTPGTLDGNYISPLSIELSKTGALANDSDTAASFLGLGGHVEVPYDPWLNPASLTVELWMRMDGTYADWRVLVGCYEPRPLIDTSIARGYRIRACTAVTGATTVQAHLGGMTAALTAEIPVDAKLSWHHIALCYDPALARAELYLDGAGPVDALPGSNFNLVAGPGRALRFAADQQLLVATTYRGLLDEIAIYGARLTGDELREHFTTATT